MLFFLWRRSCFDRSPTKLLSKSLLLLWLQSIIFTGTRPCFYIIIQGLILLCNFHFRRCFLRVFLITLFVPLLLFFQGLIIKPYLCQFRNSRASSLLLQTALLPGSPLFTTLLMRIFCYFTMCLLVFCLIKVFYFVSICNFAAVLYKKKKTKIFLYPVKIFIAPSEFQLLLLQCITIELCSCNPPPCWGI